MCIVSSALEEGGGSVAGTGNAAAGLPQSVEVRWSRREVLRCVYAL